eukprot:356443-Chlamydomonas_euryale.AAC.1
MARTGGGSTIGGASVGECRRACAGGDCPFESDLAGQLASALVLFSSPMPSPLPPRRKLNRLAAQPSPRPGCAPGDETRGAGGITWGGNGRAACERDRKNQEHIRLPVLFNGLFAATGGAEFELECQDTRQPGH